MEARDWEKFFIPYEQAVEELVIKFEALRKQFNTMGEYSPIELVLGRVKKLSSILEKSKKYNISLHLIEKKIEDIAGIRIICQFVDDIDKVVQLIRKRDGKDLKLSVKRIISETKREYRAIISLLISVQNILGTKEILAEIQIRTMAMNFWATIEHSLNYKYKENIPQKIRKRLINAAEAAFLLDQEMSEIREEITDAQKTFSIRSNAIVQILHYIQLLYQEERLELAEKYQKFFRIYGKRRSTNAYGS